MIIQRAVEGELAIEIPQVRQAAETFASKLFPRTPKSLCTKPLKALVIGALVAEGFSQADLARELGVTRQAIQKMVAVGQDRSRRYLSIRRSRSGPSAIAHDR